MGSSRLRTSNHEYPGMMKKRIQYRSLVALTLCLGAVLATAAYAEHDDGAAENIGEKIDETADKLREGAKKGIDKARETLQETGKAIGKGAEKAAESIDGDDNEG